MNSINPDLQKSIIGRDASGGTALFNQVFALYKNSELLLAMGRPIRGRISFYPIHFLVKSFLGKMDSTTNY